MEHSHEQTHDQLLKEIYEENKDILENSKQAIYLFLDDKNLVCNKKFASMLGYSSSEEITKLKGSFLQNLVDESSQQILASTYQNAMEQCIGSQIKVTWKTKSKKTIPTTVILVPIEHKKHLFALHFIQ